MTDDKESWHDFDLIRLPSTSAHEKIHFHIPGGIFTPDLVVFNDAFAVVHEADTQSFDGPEYATLSSLPGDAVTSLPPVVRTPFSGPSSRGSASGVDLNVDNGARLGRNDS